MNTKIIMDFLKDLSGNNNREWFQKNKPVYEKAKKEFEHIINLFIAEAIQIDPHIHSITAKDCIFRIYRDIRFSKDKTPYKTNFGAYIADGGKKSPFCGFYIHLSPGSSLVAAGLWQPPGDILKAVRKEIYDNTEEFLKILNDPEFKKYFVEVEGDKLKTAPKGFPKDFEHIDLLKFKSYNIIHSLTDEQIISDDFYNTTITCFRKARPFNDFLNRAVREYLSVRDV